tara:strand:- start:43 stop:1395 length:1353 start_codon:yes stop_codon:yes gene_type:complete
MGRGDYLARTQGGYSSPKKTSSRPGYGGSNTNSKGVNISPPSKSSKDISKEIDKAMSDRQDQRNQQDQGIMAKIGLGDIEKGYIGDEAFKKTQPAGQHPLRSQYDRLLAKYGDDFAETSQAKVLANYLSGVPVERGGGLGAFDPTYGGATDIDPESEEYRQMLLDSITGPNAGVPVVADYNEGIQQFLNMRNEGTYDRELAQGNLNANQFQNFMRQMKAADPSIGNQAYNKAFPDFGETLGKLIMPAVGAVAGIPGLGFLSNLNKGPQIESQIYGPGNKTFYDTSVPREDRSGGAGIPSLYGGPIQDPFNPGAGADYNEGIQQFLNMRDDPTFKPGVDPDNPLGIPAQYAGFYDSPFNIPNQGASAAVVTPVTLPSGETINFGNPYIADQFQQYMASQTQTPAAGVASLAPTTIDYASMAPQFGSYVNQGINNPRFASYLQNLQMFPRRS